MIFAPILIPMVESKSSHHGSSSDGSTKGKTSKSIKSINGGGSDSASTGNTTFNANNKVIMINFDDSYKTQVLYAKPILDQYGFKATFFEVCGWVGKDAVFHF
jgi:peptidoglycan/xylan/chitin deacetylase (PgdA/CDA1 family)